MSGIKDKIVVITGASSGIGEAAAVMLAERGAKVVLGARGLDRLEALARRIAGAGGEVAYAQTDVRRREDLTSLVNLACERYGKLDVLINNAGIGPISPLDDLRVEDWDNMIDINIKGVLYGIAAALPVFRKQGFGHFVNTASTAGIIVNPNMAVYAGTKFAVRAISEGLRQEAGDKLRVTIITPGFVNTNFTESMTSPEIKGQIRDSMDKMGTRPTRSPEPSCSRSSSPPMLTWARLLSVPRRRVSQRREERGEVKLVRRSSGFLDDFCDLARL